MKSLTEIIDDMDEYKNRLIRVVGEIDVRDKIEEWMSELADIIDCEPEELDD